MEASVKVWRERARGTVLTQAVNGLENGEDGDEASLEGDNVGTRMSGGRD